MDTDWEDAAAHVQRGYLAMLAIDSLLAFMSRLDTCSVLACLLGQLSQSCLAPAV